MEKSLAVESLGQGELLLPGRVTAALRANDRLKVYLTVLQAAASHARHPERTVPDLTIDIRAAGINEPWPGELARAARLVEGELVSADLPKLLICFADDLSIMARPVLDSKRSDAKLGLRVKNWLDWLAKVTPDRITEAQIKELTHGDKGDGDSLHLLVMDLHKLLNHMASDFASELIDGAHVWQLGAGDHELVTAFMRGLNRTALLKFNHPGLDTAATRDGERLLLQNDIGTNGAHVLVLQVANNAITLIYSDLHRGRLEFFQKLLNPFGAKWSEAESRNDAKLNDGVTYFVGNARFELDNQPALMQALEGIASRIVFLIDWNRARKRLQLLVKKADALAILDEAARQDVGHRAWLQLGAETLVFDAMQSVSEGTFRIGDRLDVVLGSDDARAFLVAVLSLACDALRNGQPGAMVGDQVRMLLSRQMLSRHAEFDILAEHAGYCHSLAQAISDGLIHNVERSHKAATHLAERAKQWERSADHLVMRVREQADRQPRWKPFEYLIERADDVADALEEAAYLFSLIADGHQQGWNNKVHTVLERLATTVLHATQDHVKAVEIARVLNRASAARENDAFLNVTWRVFQAERECDVLLRDARRVILNELHDAASMMLATDLANTLEAASDYLLVAGYALRDVVFDKTGAR